MSFAESTGVMRAVFRFAVLLLALFGASCRFGAPLYAQALHATDDLGRAVRLSQAPTRVVSLAPELTEWVYALHAEALLAGVSDDCDYPVAARSLPKIGPYFKPNLERILAARPELVLASGRGTPPELVAALEARGIACYVFFPHTPTELLNGLVRLGTVLGRTQQTRVLADSMRRELGALAAAKPRQPPSVALVINAEPLYVIGPGTLSSALLADLGGQNAYADALTPYPQVSLESLLSRGPELILLAVPTAKGGAEAKRMLARYPLKARENGLLVEVDADLFSRAGPRFMEGARLLAGYLAQARRQDETRGRR